MTREEALNSFTGIWTQDEAIINKIYEDFDEEVDEYVERMKNISDDCVTEIQELEKEFKSRICENCRFYNGAVYCKKYSMPIPRFQIPNDKEPSNENKNWGCRGFKRKVHL